MSKRKREPPKHGILITDSEGCLLLPPDLARDCGVSTGDEYASWHKGERIILVFTKNYRGRIPRSAYRGKVEPALSESTVALPNPAKAAKMKKPKARQAKAAPKVA